MRSPGIRQKGQRSAPAISLLVAVGGDRTHAIGVDGDYPNGLERPGDLIFWVEPTAEKRDEVLNLIPKAVIYWNGQQDGADTLPVGPHSPLAGRQRHHRVRCEEAAGAVKQRQKLRLTG